MTNHRTQARRSLVALLIPVLVCLTALGVFAAFAAEPCKTYTLEVPNPADLKLPDGEHVIAGVATDDGKLEARVTVKGKVASEPHYFLGGKPFQKIPESQVPSSIRECLKSARRPQIAASFSSDWLGSRESNAATWIMPAAYAKAPKCFITVAKCSPAGGHCCYAQACCISPDGFFDCAFATACR